MTGRQPAPLDSLYGLAVFPASALSPSVAGFGGLGVAVGLGLGVGVGVGVTLGVGVGIGVGVGVGVDAIVIGGGVVYPLGQIDPITPAAEGVEVGGLVRVMTPI